MRFSILKSRDWSRLIPGLRKLSGIPGMESLYTYVLRSTKYVYLVLNTFGCTNSLDLYVLCMLTLICAVTIVQYVCKKQFPGCRHEARSLVINVKINAVKLKNLNIS
jgi:hypothetical protein